MTCRTTRLGSALTSYVKILEGLEEYQSLSMLHEIIRDAPSHIPPVSLAERAEFINEMKAKVAASPSFTTARKASLEQRLEEAMTQPVAAEIFYATKRIEARSRVAKVALDDYYTKTARELGESVGNIRARLRASYEESKRERSLGAPEEWVAEFRRRPGQAGLPMDRHTAYAMWRIDTEIAEREGEVVTRPTVTNHQRVHGAGISAVGYDRETGRLEVEFRSRQGQFYAFQNVPEALAADLAQAERPTEFFNAHLRSNSDYQYATQEAADAAATVNQCRTCGQFAGDNHGCPTQNSPEEMAATVERATIQQRVARARAAVASGTREERLARYVRLGGDNTEAEERVDSEDRLAELSPDTTLRHRQNQRLEATMQPYRGESGTFRSTALSTVRRILEEEPRAVFPVRSNIKRVVDELTGEVVEVPHGIVTGRVTAVREMGGYAITAVTAPGDSGEDQLKCSCGDYQRNYDCVHVRQTVADMNQRINAEFLRTPHTLRAAVAEANAAAHAEFEASVAQQATSREAWEAGGDGVMYSGDEGAEVFQRDYKAARDAFARGEMPVPYMTENATDGLGAPGPNGRGFGIEMEFAWRPGMTAAEKRAATQAIAREMYELGLLRRPERGWYHGDQNVYFEHQGGWKFEEDGSCAGEMISPVMRDTPETWATIPKVIDIITRHGGVVDASVGCHVNISAGNYDHQVENANRLLGTFDKFQDPFYRQATNPGSPAHRTALGSTYAEPNRSPGAGFSTVAQAANANRRPHAINLGHTGSGTSNDRVEFRIFDGTLNAAAIQSQINLALAATEHAFRDTDYQPEGSRRFGSTHAENRARRDGNPRLSGEQWRESTAPTREMLDLLFRDHKRKAQQAAMFAITNWSRSRR